MPVFDASILLCFLSEQAQPPLDPATGQPLVDAKARISHLIDNLEAGDKKVVIPTPALSEVLVTADPAESDLLNRIRRNRVFRIVPFGERAAVELAAMTRAAVDAGDFRAGSPETRAKLKFDRQIVAVARVEKETTVYSDDTGLAKFARQLGIEVIGTNELPLPPGHSQGELDFD